MTSDASQVSDLNPTDPTLTDRVRAHLAHLTKDAASVTGTSQAQREAQSLQRAYREMRGLYRNYRRKAGTPAVPELRSAVHAFRRGQSLTSLVHIASFLDDRKLLAW
ncbi:MAG TPA: hypothetical protein VLB12_06985 [Gemmatimonadales bacterium]|nr:hypothetical protein [Gemmatimonadales bacterium]